MVGDWPTFRLTPSSSAKYEPSRRAKGEVPEDDGNHLLLRIWFDPLELAARQAKMANGIRSYSYRDLGYDFGMKLRIEAVGVLGKDAMDWWHKATAEHHENREEVDWRRDLERFVGNEFPSLFSRVPKQRLPEFIEGMNNSVIETKSSKKAI